MPWQLWCGLVCVPLSCRVMRCVAMLRSALYVDMAYIALFRFATTGLTQLTQECVVLVLRCVDVCCAAF